MSARTWMIEPQHVTKFVREGKCEIAPREVAVKTDFPSQHRIETHLRAPDPPCAVIRPRVVIEAQVRKRNALRRALGTDDNIGLSQRVGRDEDRRTRVPPHPGRLSERAAQIVLGQA